MFGFIDVKTKNVPICLYPIYGILNTAEMVLLQGQSWSNFA